MITLTDFAATPAARSLSPSPSVLVGAPRPARQLLVDDKRMIINPLSRFFQSLGYNVHAFVDPLLARRRFDAGPEDFDLVLSDLAMPGLDGCAFSRHVLGLRPSLPVLIYTGYLTESAEETLSRLGVRRILAKPSSLAELSAAVAEWVAEPILG